MEIIPYVAVFYAVARSLVLLDRVNTLVNKGAIGYLEEKKKNASESIDAIKDDLNVPIIPPDKMLYFLTAVVLFFDICLVVYLFSILASR